MVDTIISSIVTIINDIITHSNQTSQATHKKRLETINHIIIIIITDSKQTGPQVVRIADRPAAARALGALAAGALCAASQRPAAYCFGGARQGRGGRRYPRGIV